MILGTTAYSKLQITVCRKAHMLKQTRDPYMLVAHVHMSWTKSLASKGGQSFLEIPEARGASMRRGYNGVSPPSE